MSDVIESEQPKCKHGTLISLANIMHLEDRDLRIVELTIRCAICEEVFRFLGAPTGLSMTSPTVDVPGTTLHIPIVPGERSIEDIRAGAIKFKV